MDSGYPALKMVSYRLFAEYVLSSSLALAVAGVFSYSYRLVAPPILPSAAGLTILLTSFLFALIGVVALSVLYLMMVRGMDTATRVVVSTALTPFVVLAIAVFVQIIVMALFKIANPGLASLSITGALFFTAMLQLLILADAISEKMRNFIMIFYGSIFGAFMGVVVHPVAALVVVATVAVYDLFFVYLYLSKKAVKVKMTLSVRGENVSIGIGEFIFYALPPSVAFYRYDVTTGLISTLLVVIGIAMNILIMPRRQVIAGITVPTTLGILPTAFRLFFF